MRSFLTLVAFAAAALASSAGGCGEDPFCGDGVVNQLSEVCDDGNDDETDVCLNNCQARSIPRLTVKWAFNRSDELGFNGDSCTDVGAREVRVTLSGAETFRQTESCSFRQVQFPDLPTGTYDVTVEVLDGGGSPLASDVTEPYEFGGGESEEVTVSVPHDAWLASYQGTYYFRLTWGGADCAAASPPVTKQVLTFTRPEGELVASMTKAGAGLDNSESDCYPATESEPQTVLDVPFGPATLQVQGLDDTDQVMFESTFDTFIGAGLNNPEQALDVAPVPPA